MIVPTTALARRRALIWRAIDSILDQAGVCAVPTVIVNGPARDPDVTRELMADRPPARSRRRKGRPGERAASGPKARRHALVCRARRRRRAVAGCAGVACRGARAEPRSRLRGDQRIPAIPRRRHLNISDMSVGRARSHSSILGSQLASARIVPVPHRPRRSRPVRRHAGHPSSVRTSRFGSRPRTGSGSCRLRR